VHVPEEGHDAKGNVDEGLRDGLAHDAVLDLVKLCLDALGLWVVVGLVAVL